VDLQYDGVMLRSPMPGRVSDAVFERVAMTLLAIGAFLPYFAINRLTLDWPAADLAGPVDRLIPFSASWELVYFSIYFYVFVLVAYIRDARLFRSVVLSFCLIQFACYAVFLAFPVGLKRSAELDLHAFLEWGVALNYTLDQPRNLFPSLHLGNAFMVSLLLFRVQPRAGLWALAWASLIGYSTMAAKHHFFADVVAGILVALVVDRLVMAPAVAAAQGRELLNPARYAWAVIVLYPATALLLYLAWRMGWQPFAWPPG
jgi:membrane-associated phospholipid phosphatase